MTIEHLEQISGYTVHPQLPRPERSGVRRSARLMAQAIRASRRHGAPVPAEERKGSEPSA
jgi:hypothetical protein